MAKKDLQAGRCYNISTDSTDNPKLGAKILSDGRESLFLDFYFGYEMIYNNATDKMEPKKKRRREFLKLYIWRTPRTPQQRQENKDTLKLAKKVRHEKGQELLDQEKGYKLQTKKTSLNFLECFQEYIDGYTKKDVRMVKIALQRFKDFLRDTPEYSKFVSMIKPEYIDKNMMVAFTEYLQSRSRGEGAKSIYKRFKKFINYLIDEEVIIKNPCHNVVIKTDENILRKDVLSLDEIEQLIATTYEKQNENVRKAFIFCLYTGIRYCDVKDLTFGNVDFSNKILSFEQNKTRGHSANSGVVIPLNDGLMRLIGEPTSEQTKDSLIFPLPSYEMCLRSVKLWVKKAGIDKHISWHCARHSFAVNILNNGANIKTVASLLGHSGLSQTEKYTRAIDSLKQQAINSLPTLNINI